jgi:hypothetical protein
MITIHKRGQIVYNNRIVCNRIGLTPEITKSVGEQISFDLYNTWTVTKLTHGIFLSWYAIPGENHPLSWYSRNGKSFFLSTPNKIDGHNASWKGHLPFCQLIDLPEVDLDLAWTFFLSYNTKALTVSTVWDPAAQVFITPDRWIVHSSYLPRWIDLHIDPLYDCEPMVVDFKQGERIDSVFDNHEPITMALQDPLLVVIYCGSTIKTLKILSKENINLRTINNRSQDKYEAYLIAHFKREDLSYFETLKFTTSELYKFWDCLKKAKKRFFRNIYDKVIFNKYVSFPDKLYTNLHLGKILDSQKTCEQKQLDAWRELTRCAKGYRIQAITAFYTYYMKEEMLKA